MDKSVCSVLRRETWASTSKDDVAPVGGGVLVPMERLVVPDEVRGRGVKGSLAWWSACRNPTRDSLTSASAGLAFHTAINKMDPVIIVVLNFSPRYRKG